MKNRKLGFLLVFNIFTPLFTFPQATYVQDTTQSTHKSGLINTYIDSPDWYTDLDFFRIEIPYINHMRDRADADVHILITTQTTGSDGKEFTINFIGLGNFSAQRNELIYLSSNNDTEDEIRKELVRYFKIGLMPFVSKSSVINHIDVSYNAPVEDQVLSKEIDDPWDFWTFRTSISGNFNGEKTYKYGNLNSSVNAKRVTEDWKLNFYISSNQSRTDYDYSGEESYTDNRKSNYLEGTIIKSLTSHWSTGVAGGVSNSTYNNYDLRFGFLSGIEYNIYPYSESTRRQLAFQYLLGVDYYDYHKETIYLKMSEQLFTEQLNIEYENKQPWGSIKIGLRGKHYMHDIQKFNIQFDHSIELKLIKGFSVDIWGHMTFLRDQLSLPNYNATYEEVLLRRREIETSYYYNFSIGLSYTFGSMYNNVVNPRFGD